MFFQYFLDKNYVGIFLYFAYINFTLTTSFYHFIIFFGENHCFFLIQISPILFLFNLYFLFLLAPSAISILSFDILFKISLVQDLLFNSKISIAIFVVIYSFSFKYSIILSLEFIAVLSPFYRRFITCIFCFSIIIFIH